MIACDLQRVRMNELEVRAFRKPLPQQRNEARILFDRENLPRFLQEQLSQRAKPGADLEHTIGRGDFGRSDNAPELVVVVEKILAERFRKLDAVLLQDFAHLPEGDHASTSPNVATARASSRSAIVSGGVNPSTLLCSLTRMKRRLRMLP